MTWCLKELAKRAQSRFHPDLPCGLHSLQTCLGLVFGSSSWEEFTEVTVVEFLRGLLVLFLRVLLSVCADFVLGE